MFEIITVIAVILAVAIAIILILAATKPNTLRVQRAIGIRAPAEQIFPFINDFHQWGTWSPYENKDPVMKRTYSGADSGEGAVYAWDGNNNVGSGVFMSRLMQVFINLDNMIGKDFEVGLANLKKLAEK